MLQFISLCRPLCCNAQVLVQKYTESCQSEHTFFSLIFIGVQLVYNVVLVFSVQQSESVIQIQISTNFQILFPCQPSQSIESSSLCYTAVSISYFIYSSEQFQSQSPNLHPFYITRHCRVPLLSVCVTENVYDNARFPPLLALLTVLNISEW